MLHSSYMKKPTVYVICGPTATGKTRYSLELAKNVDGEIISADSRQVYRELNIGTAKITKQEMQGIPHHLIDVVDPEQMFTVADFQKLGRKALQDIITRGKTPIICGGTGYYINALIYDQNIPEVSPNRELRTKLEKLPLNVLQEKLHNADPERYKTIDNQNRVRLVRALEIINALGKVPQKSDIEQPESIYNIEWIYLDFPDEILKKRIHERNIKRIEMGMIQEAEKLHQEGLSFERMNMLGLEYRYMAQLLKGEIPDVETFLKILNTKTWHFVKRQRTWFKKYLPVEVFDDLYERNIRS